jgi:hypothetical protein
VCWSRAAYDRRNPDTIKEGFDRSALYVVNHPAITTSSAL